MKKNEPCRLGPALAACVVAAASLAQAQPRPALEAGSRMYLEALRRAGQPPQRRDAKVVDGSPARIEDNPWQVGLLVASQADPEAAQFCGGSMIARDWVLTAAHCVDGGTRPEQVHVLSGTGTLRGSGERSRVDRIVVHPGYSRERIDADIALLHVSPQGPPLRGQVVAGPEADAEMLMRYLPMRVTGWGARAGGGELTTDLRGVDLPYVAPERCGSPQAYGADITPNMLCAGLDEGGISACNGDSGGPLTVDFNGRRRLVGVVSFGRKDCGRPYGYSVFTRVSQFTGWVTTTTGGAAAWR